MISKAKTLLVCATDKTKMIMGTSRKPILTLGFVGVMKMAFAYCVAAWATDWRTAPRWKAHTSAHSYRLFPTAMLHGLGASSRAFPLTNILPCHKPSIDPRWYI